MSFLPAFLRPLPALRLAPAALAFAGLAGCSGGLTSMARPVAGQVQMVEVGGQSYALRVIPDLKNGGRSTRLVAGSPEAAKRVFSEICDGRSFSAADWPDGRLLRDSATGEWAITGDCPFLLARR